MHQKFWVVTTVIVILCLLTGTMSVSAPLKSATVVVSGTINGLTEEDIGAVEGPCRFDITELADLGITNYRMYSGMARLEPEDDDGVYGSPSIAEIKADPNVINWAFWDNIMTYDNTYFWASGGNPPFEGDPPAWAPVSFVDIVGALNANGIKPVLTLRNVNNFGDPEWAPNPPTTTEDRNEWWEHVFAVVYWLNVRENYQVYDFQVHNEPNNSGQGWGGTIEDYYEFVKVTHDAIDYVFTTYLPGETYHVYAPVSNNTSWVRDCLINVDPYFDVVDWHRYGDPTSQTIQIHEYIRTYNSDNYIERICLSEWGTYRGKYDSVGNAINWAHQLMEHSLPGDNRLDISQIFCFYDWNNTMTGLIDKDGNKTETYYAFRLMIRGLQGAKDTYATSTSDTNIEVISSKGANYLNIIAFNTTNFTYNIEADVSAHIGSGIANVWEYGETNKDVLVATPSISNGLFTFSVPASGIVLAQIPL